MTRNKVPRAKKTCLCKLFLTYTWQLFWKHHMNMWSNICCSVRSAKISSPDSDGGSNIGQPRYHLLTLMVGPSEGTSSENLNSHLVLLLLHRVLLFLYIEMKDQKTLANLGSNLRNILFFCLLQITYCLLFWNGFYTCFHTMKIYSKAPWLGNVFTNNTRKFTCVFRQYCYMRKIRDFMSMK